MLAYNSASRSLPSTGGWNVRLLGVSGSVMSAMSVTTNRAQSRDTTRARRHFQLSDHRRIHRWGQSSPWVHPWRMPRLPGERATDTTSLVTSSVSKRTDSPAEFEPSILLLALIIYTNAREDWKDDKIAFPMIGLSGMANLGFLKMNIFKMEISAPDGKQTSEELNFICRGKKKN